MSTVDHMNQVYCANVYDEATQIAGDGFPQHQRDLFMEQGTFYPRDTMLARVIVIATCLSIRLSRAGIVSKRRKLAS